MSVALVLLGLFVLLDTLREPGRTREARARASFTAAGARFGSAGTRILLLSLALSGVALLLLGTWAVTSPSAAPGADGAPAIGFGLFLLACGLGGPPREADVHFGRTEVRVGLRRIPYEAFHRFEVDEGGGVLLQGSAGLVRGCVGPEEVPRLRAFLADRVEPRLEQPPDPAD
ncbi:MAG TPA: hypothetical protein VKF62_08165, partial [Planctomycetota bacterium]|nr:hypothetical protein [Planctomycetota bacterium]